MQVDGRMKDTLAVGGAQCSSNVGDHVPCVGDAHEKEGGCFEFWVAGVQPLEKVDRVYSQLGLILGEVIGVLKLEVEVCGCVCKRVYVGCV